MEPMIRPATPEDINDLLLIESEGQNRWNRGQFAEELKLNFSAVHIIEEQGEVAGFAVIWHVAGDIQLNNIGVRKKYRRRGMGSLLMNHVVTTSFDHGSPGKIFLEVSAENRSALLFYRKHGFTETGRRKNYYNGIDAILMERGPGR
ncbi:MAG: ribosomal protein S18-alanine N-acetyltransferase [Spirochaetes bacterium]|nr:ribosomal protein S18-alanine N-acetyltransferase [Spirochaetota bacterium]